MSKLVMSHLVHLGPKGKGQSKPRSINTIPTNWTDVEEGSDDEGPTVDDEAAFIPFPGDVHDFCTAQPTAPTSKVAKVIILGDVAVGKTSLIYRFGHRAFSSGYKATIGVDFEVEHFSILGSPFNLQIWDTAGAERFRCIASSYYRGAQVVILVFDMTVLQSLDNCKSWLQAALQVNQSKPIVFLVGSKRDILSSDEWRTARYHAMRVASEISAEFWPVSSKTGIAVDWLFGRVAALAFLKQAESEMQSSCERGKLRPVAESTLKLNESDTAPRKPKCAGCSR